MIARRLVAAVGAALLGLRMAHAADIQALSALNQGQFSSLTQGLGDALSYRDMEPAAPLGLTGLDIGVTATDTRLDGASGWDAATGSSTNQIPTVGVQVDKGLPANFDIGLLYNVVPGSNARVIGGALSYALIGGGLLAPALTIRGTYTRMMGVSAMNLNTRSVEICLSKGFTFITPYIGVGRVRTAASADGTSLSPVTLYNNKIYVGADINLGIMNFDIEADHMAGSMSYAANVGWRL
ncbi:MAG: hypothetical protein ACYCXG_02545 [Acidiferrobacter sp.]